MGLDQEYRVVSDGGRLDLVDHGYAVPHLYDYFVPSSFAAEVAWAGGAEGPATVVSTGCTSGIDAVGHAVELIREGSADVMIAGATDAPISPITVACFDAIKATTPAQRRPRARLPAVRRHPQRVRARRGRGGVRAGGAERGHAGAARTIYAEIAGYATRCNAFHMTGLRPDGREMAEAIRVALDEARLNAEEIDYINAHGSGTKQNDRHETAAFKRSLGEHAYRTPVSSIKSMVGHSLGAIGSIEIAASVLAIEQQRGAADGEPAHARPGVRPGLRAADRAGRPTDAVLTRRQRVRRLPERDGADQPGRERHDRAAVVTGIGVARAERAGHRGLLGGHAGGQERHRPDHPVRPDAATRPSWPVRCPASTPRTTCRAGCCRRPTR